LNSSRSAIASVFKIIYPQRPPLASNQLIIDFFSAKKRSAPSLPNVRQETFDIAIINAHVRSLGKTEDLSFACLQQKALYLLTIATMWQPRSDIGTLQFRDITFNKKGESLLGLTIISRTPKEIIPKSSKLGTIEDVECCPIHTLFAF
ncbi:hypothetical protein BD408DRAFT_318679, partial [Parasitella parasitica]